MTDTPMRERIVEAQARAMAGVLAEFEIHIGPVVEDYLSKAAFDAALEVMMEPDEASIRAGDCFIHREPGAEPNTIGKWVLKPTALKKDTP